MVGRGVGVGMGGRGNQICETCRHGPEIGVTCRQTVKTTQNDI